MFWNILSYGLQNIVDNFHLKEYIFSKKQMKKCFVQSGGCHFRGLDLRGVYLFKFLTFFYNNFSYLFSFFYVLKTHDYHVT